MKILLAIDTSSASQVALGEVAARPWPAGASFEVVSVIEPSHLWTTSEVAQESVREAEEVVKRAKARLCANGFPASGGTLSGDPKTVILDQVQSCSADLVIVGSHGASALTRFLLGNVAAAVLRYAPCSVEVVRARTGNGNRGRMKVLLATDGSASSELAARSIAERPWPRGTEIRVFSAVELILPASRAFLQPPVIHSAFLESVRVEAMKRAQDAIASARQILASSDSGGLDVSDSVSVLLDPPKTVILDEALGWGADLIVLGSHGRRGMDRFLLGSVSEAVAMHAGCSVEVIRSTGATQSL
jgi:nucleotide-binding universal stress UspA family protein